ncbi:hypothetical protein HAX54_045372 [Datura stramonium]|uniref:At1g61320/AtMIF1 LRR domain-containing protein n=1 Tax=Datura stramonium TaxID=4076 RepID=A0ABS8SQL3_DATST|nr:hypothetical protein [Datura stramonium]
MAIGNWRWSWTTSNSNAAQLTTLSKTWYTAWSFPFHLNFGDQFFYRQGDDCWIPSENIPPLFNIVNQTLANRQRQKVSIQKFWLGRLPSCHWSSYFHNWFKTLVACNIKKLILQVVDSFNTFPLEIFAAKGLDFLDLHGFKLELVLNGIKFSSFRKLILSRTYLDDQFNPALCASCSSLDDLSLSNCHGQTRLQIAGTLPKLRRIWVNYLPAFEMVDIIELNLEDIYIDRSH